MAEHTPNHEVLSSCSRRATRRHREDAAVGIIEAGGSARWFRFGRRAPCLKCVIELLTLEREGTAFRPFLGQRETEVLPSRRRTSPKRHACRSRPFNHAAAPNQKVDMMRKSAQQVIFSLLFTIGMFLSSSFPPKPALPLETSARSDAHASPPAPTSGCAAAKTREKENKRYVQRRQKSLRHYYARF